MAGLLMVLEAIAPWVSKGAVTVGSLTVGISTAHGASVLNTNSVSWHHMGLRFGSNLQKCCLWLFQYI